MHFRKMRVGSLIVKIRSELAQGKFRESYESPPLWLSHHINKPDPTERILAEELEIFGVIFGKVLVGMFHFIVVIQAM